MEPELRSNFHSVPVPDKNVFFFTLETNKCETNKLLLQMFRKSCSNHNP